MRNRPQSTRMNGVPDAADMRAARQELWVREQARRVASANDPEAEKVARDLANDPHAQKHAPFFSVFDTEAEADNDLIGFALENIIEARKRRPRNGTPLRTDKMKDALDTLSATGIPVSVGSDTHQSKAEQHLIGYLGYTPSEARGAVRRLVNLRSRLGIRTPKGGRPPKR